MTKYNWSNVLGKGRTIDSTTARKAMKISMLEKQIEWHFKNMIASIPNGGTYMASEKIIKELALEYKKETGDWYRRDWR